MILIRVKTALFRFAPTTEALHVLVGGVRTVAGQLVISYDVWGEKVCPFMWASIGDKHVPPARGRQRLHHELHCGMLDATLLHASPILMHARHAEHNG